MKCGIFIFGRRFALKVLDEWRLLTVAVLDVAES